MINLLGSRPLTLALMVLLTIISLFAATQLPVIGAIMLSVAGLPAFLIILAWGVSWFLLYSAITMVITGLLGNLSLAVLLVPMLLVPAAVLSWALKCGYRPLKAVGVTLLVATLFSSASWALVAGMSQEEIVPIEEQFASQLAVVEKQLVKLEESGEASPEAIETIRENVKETFAFLTLLVPVTFVFVWHLISLAVLYSGAYRLAPGFNYSLQPLQPFAQWRFNWNLIWLFIAGWALFYGINWAEAVPGNETLRAIGANCMAISRIIYFIAGLSLLFFMFEKYRMGSLARVGLSCLALFLNQAVVWLGIIDIWADFRTPKPALFASEDSDDDF
jgi:hypothetical protein